MDFLNKANTVNDKINSIHPSLIIFILLVINLLTFSLNSNEEQYYAIAKQFCDVNWIPNAHSINDFPGHKLIFQLLVGNFLKVLSFENTKFILSLLGFLLTSIPIGGIFKKLEIPTFGTILIFQFIYLHYPQAFFAGEFIFKGFEPKNLSYIFLFISLNKLLEERYLKSFIYASIAANFHILVGGWFFAASVLYLFLIKVSWKKILKNGLVFLAGILPMLIYLLNEIIVNSRTVINGINLNWVYTFFRAPHHTAIFNTMDGFVTKHLIGVLISTAIFLILLFIKDKLVNKIQIKIAYLLIAILSLILLSVFIAYFDHTGFYVKYYPFRLSALSKLLVLALAFSILYSLVPQKGISIISLSALIVFSPFLIKTIIHNSYWKIYNSYIVSTSPNNELYEYIKTHTNSEDVFLFLGEGAKSDYNLKFIRQAERDRFFVYKFIPTGSEKVYNWYLRYLEKEKTENDIQYLNDLTKKFRVDYVVSKKPINAEGLTKIEEHGAILYKIDKLQSILEKSNKIINVTEINSSKPIYRDVDKNFISLTSNCSISYETHMNLTKGQHKFAFEFSGTKFKNVYAKGKLRISTTNDILYEGIFDSGQKWELYHCNYLLEQSSYVRFEIIYFNDKRSKDHKEDRNLYLRKICFN